MADFSKKKIEIRYFTEDFGPYVFDFASALPDDVDVSSCTVRSFLGMLVPADDLSAEVETTSELVDTARTIVSGEQAVSVFFDYPTTAAFKGSVNHTLVFELTLSNGGKHPFYFQYVHVK